MLSRVCQIAQHLKRPSAMTPVMNSLKLNEPFKRTLRTAACLIIGDEVLNGKTVDTNSANFAKFCFGLGIDLRRIEVISDDESEIVEAARRMSANYDLVVTSGGIGPTHDDITYPSLAKAFSLPLELHSETAHRMRTVTSARQNAPPFDWDTPSPTLRARMRMATLPTGEGVKVLYVGGEDMWVPIVVVNYNVHILPGVPGIFVQLLEGLKELWRVEGRIDEQGKSVRVLISTPLQESEVASYLEELQERVGKRGIKIGSYPRWGKKRNTITLVGADKVFIESVVSEVEKATKGRRVTEEGEDDSDQEEVITGAKEVEKITTN